MKKEILTAIVEEDSVSLMEHFDKAMIERISMLVEDRKQNLAQNILIEGEGDDDDEENMDDDFMLDDDLNILPLDDESDDELTDEDEEAGEEDADTVEEEQLDELSKKTMANYAKGAAAELNDKAYTMGKKGSLDSNDQRKVINRRRWHDRAVDRLAKE